MVLINKTIVIMCVMLVADSLKLPNYLKKCKKGPESQQCVIDNTKAAINQIKSHGEPKFNLQNINPLHVDKMELNVTPELTIYLKDVKFYGIDLFKIKNGFIDEEKISIQARVLSQLEIIGNYDMDGKIMILPIKGKGLCNMTLVNFDLDYNAYFTRQQRKTKDYLQVLNEDTKLTISNVKRVYWHFENLFDGDTVLTNIMEHFLTENWKEVFDEAKPALEQAAAFAIINYYVNGFLHYIPIDNLFE